MWFYYIIVLLVIACDFASKALIMSSLSFSSQSIHVLPCLNLVYVLNKGISFSMLQNWGPVSLIILTATITLTVAYCLHKDASFLGKIALALILGGAVGNLIDRIRFGGVVDFLDFHIGSYHWPAFNIADSAICLGVLLLLYQMIMYPIKESKKVTFTKKKGDK